MSEQLNIAAVRRAYGKMRSAVSPAEIPPYARIYRVRISCVSGPWLEGACSRILECTGTDTLSDLACAAEEAFDFEPEDDFEFFTAADAQSERTLLSEAFADADSSELAFEDVYEDLNAEESLANALQSEESLFMVSHAPEGDWIFECSKDPEFWDVALPDKWYPDVVYELSEGASPMQHNHDWAPEAEDGEGDENAPEGGETEPEYE